ncbi:MAG: CcmD family protein [Myxococcota bacterium]|jgi:CcmD family protein|nr:CcmD family protein [Myxococcota bacterium]
MSAETAVILAYLAIWMLSVSYVFVLRRRQRHLQQELAELSKRLESVQRALEQATFAKQD